MSTTSQMAEAAATLDRAVSMDYLRSLMNPRMYNVMPDSTVETANSTSQAIDYSMSFGITAPLAFAAGATGNSVQAEGCLASEGIILQLPKYGPFALAHMGFVKGSLTAPIVVNLASAAYGTIPHNIRGLTLLGKYIAGPPMTTIAWNSNGPFPNQNPARFEWRGVVALPRTGLGAIAAGPDIESLFSRVRMYTGILQLEGNSVSVGAGSLSGAVTTSVIADTRAISDASYAVSALAQQSVYRGDVIKNAKLLDGATMVIGPDYDRSYNAVNRLTTARMQGEMIDLGLLTHNATPISNMNVDAVGQTMPPVAVSSFWVSPWQCDFRVAHGVTTVVGGLVTDANTPFHNNIVTGAIDEMGCFDVEVTVPWYPWVLPVAGAEHVLQIVTVNLVVNWIHIYCNINDNGTINYNMFSEVEQVQRSASQAAWMSIIGGNVSFATSTPAPDVLTTSARKYRKTFNGSDGGKYVGTYCMLSTHIGPYFDTFPGGMFVTVNVMSPRVRVRATTVDEIGAVGPAHIARYDGVAITQELILRGMSLVEGATTGNLAPFAQQSIPRQLSVFNPRVQLLVKELFNSSPYFKRCMSTVEYNTRIVPYIDNMTAKTLVDDSHENQRIAVAVQAAGLLGAVKDVNDDNVQQTTAGNRRQRE